MRTVLVSLVALTLAACSGGGPRTTTITIAAVNNGDMVRLRRLSGVFERMHPGIRLKWVVLEENVLRQKVTTDVAIRGGQFDVVMVGAYEIPIWAKRNWLVALDDLGPRYAASDLLGPVRAAVSADGRQYAAPFDAEGTITMYRTDLFRRAGLTMPAKPTWEFLDAAAGKLNDPARGVYGICLRGKAGWGENMALLLTMAHAFGGQFVDERWRPQFDSAAWSRTIGLYAGMLRRSGPPGASANGFNENLALFAQGKCAIWFDSTVAAPFLSDPATSRVVGRTGFAPGPDEGLGRSSSWLWTWALAVPSSSKRKSEAKEFIRWAGGPAYVKYVVRREGWLAVPPGTRRSVYASAGYRRAAPFSAVTLDAINAARPASPSPLPVPYVGVQYAAVPEWQGIGTEIGQQFSSVVAGRVAPAEALAEAQAATRRQLSAAGYQ